MSTTALAAPHIPTPAHPNPAFPIATDGSLREPDAAFEGFRFVDLAYEAEALYTGRSIAGERTHHPMHHYRMLHHATRADHVHANGLCNGRASGAGHTSCGTATRGPVGGITSRN